MKIEQGLRFVYSEFIHGGHLLALGGISIIFVSSVLMKIDITWDIIIVVYLLIELIYQYNHFKEFQVDQLCNSERTKHIEKYISILPSLLLVLFIILISIPLVLNKNYLSIAFVSFLLLLGFIYSHYLKKITKKIIGFKSYFVALMWTSLIVFLALYYSISSAMLSSLILVSIFVFLREFIGVSFSDIKDIKTDRKEGLRTFAIVFGKERLIDILNILNVLASIPILLGVYLHLFPEFSIMLLLTVPYTFYYLQKTRSETANISFLTSILVNGEDALWLVYILIGKTLL